MSSSDPARVAPRPRSRRLLLAILLAGLALRALGLGFGLPLELRPDEAWYRDTVVRIATTGDPNPRLFAYPGLPLHALYAVSAAVHGLARGLGADVPETLAAFAADVTTSTWIQRVLSCLFGVATLLLVHRLGRRLGGEATGLVGAGLLAVSHLHVRDSHFGVVDVPATFFVVLALLAVVGAVERGRLRDFALAGAAAGLATAMRYTPALLAVALAVAACTRGRARCALARLSLAAAAMIATFLAGAPYTLLDWDGFRSEFGLQAAVSTGAGRGFDVAALGKHLTLSLGAGMGWPVLLLAALGLLTCALRPRLAPSAVIAYGLAHLALIGTAGTDFVRYALPLTPIVALLAATALVRLARPAPARLRPALLLGLALLVAAPVCVRAVRHDLLLARASTFELARDWIGEHLAPDDRVVFTSPAFRRKAGLAAWTTAWDPAAILWGDRPTWVVVTAHPHPHFEPPGGAAALLAATSSEVVARFDAFREGTHATAVFDEQDSFYFPFAGLGAVRRGGPDVVIHRVVPGPRPATLPAPPPAVLAVVGGGFRDQLGLDWTPAPDGPPVLAWALRYATQAELEAGHIPPPHPVPGGLGRFVFGGVPPGTYWVAVSPVGLGGEGPMQSFGPVTLP